MATYHEKGYLSNKRDFFYYNAENEQWFRLLVRGGYEQGYLKEVAIALTPPHGFIEVGDLLEISKEFIHVYDPIKPKEGDIHTHVLPREVYNDLLANLGGELTEKLVDYNYIAVIDLNKLLACNDNGGECLMNILDPEPRYDRVKARLETVTGYYKKLSGEFNYG